MSRKILIMSNKSYEPVSKNLVESIIINSGYKIPIIYYTIGFESELDYPNLICNYFEPVEAYGNDFYFYKPNILYHALENFGGNFLFLDSDILIGRRFNIEFFQNDGDYPLLTTISQEYPIIVGPNWMNTKIYNPDLKYIGSDGIERLAVEVDMDGHVTGSPGSIIYNEAALMCLFGVKKRSMRYVGTCLISYGPNCEDFLLEWKSLVENPWIRRRGKEYLPFHEETAINIILWRRQATRNWDSIFVNTGRYDVVERVELDDNIHNQYIIDDGYTWCRDSKEVFFYHGFKTGPESQKVLHLLRQNSGSNPG
ncbi:hypothetical protein EBU71_10155 [bacterium]|nr:hypothetical protein [Candidatus Elulimicrobium humile]